MPILAKERLEGALNVRTRDPHEFTAAEIELLMAIAGQVAQAIENAKLYASAQRRVAELEALAQISEAVSESLYLEESLSAIVRTTMGAVSASTGAALVLEDGRVAWPEGRAGAHAVRLPLRSKGRQIGELVCDRDMPFTGDERKLLASIASQAAVALEHGRAVMRGVLAQEIHHRVKNNLQTVASLLRLQARSPGTDARKALEDSVNRILAIAAVHEVLTERRDDDVDLGELVERLRATIVQGVGAGKQVSSRVEPVSLQGDRATALALVFSELFQNALEHGGNEVRVELASRNGHVCLTVADDGDWRGDAEEGTGLSIVRALVHDELKGTLSLGGDRGGLRAEVRFPGEEGLTKPRLALAALLVPRDGVLSRVETPPYRALPASLPRNDQRPEKSGFRQTLLDSRTCESSSPRTRRSSGSTSAGRSRTPGSRSAPRRGTARRRWRSQRASVPTWPSST